ncbi:MAG TPA: hypothetical protein VG860_02750 [Terriglobia bacterium]|jgi:hypothetical protein|nr:hypothetical protein [Terriglobia bacterium]
MNADSNTPSAAANVPAASKPNEQDAIYQGGRVVGKALDARVDTEAREIHFGEISNSDDLLLPEDCEFREYRILIQRMEFATREERGAVHKGRVLRGVVAEILGYREQ